MERVGEHPVPVGPLAVRWLGHDLPELRAGVAAPARVALRNDGTLQRIDTLKRWANVLAVPESKLARFPELR